MNGVGGDMFLLYYHAESGEVYALNASGRSGSRATLRRVRDGDGRDGTFPATGPLSVSVPGAVGGWAEALERFGTISFAEALEPAERLAHGFTVTERLAADIAEEAEKLGRDPEAARIYLPRGAPPAAGATLGQHDLAATISRLRTNGPDEFYSGETARRIVDHLTRQGGLLTAGDLSAHRSEWVEPIRRSYRGVDVHAMPPSNQGVMLLQILGLLEDYDLDGLGHNSADYLELLAQAIGAAAQDRDRYVADLAAMSVTADQMLDPAHLARLAETFEGGRFVARDTLPDQPNTVYAIAVDAHGNVVSLIQSLFHSFGSGIVVPGTGVVLHNRGSQFSLDPAHPNVVAPGKRPYHTLCPALALKDGVPWLAFGTPGGDGQTHTLVQVLNDILVFGMTPQEAVDAPRLRRLPDGRLAIEDRVPETVRTELSARGFEVLSRTGWTAEFGGAQAVLIGRGMAEHRAGADRRREGWALGL
jgi:gamma-glutamyltranspeptidase / glutathione hydrolase